MDQMEVKQLFGIPHEGDDLTRTARRKIDDDIDKLERTILSLKRKRNGLSPTFAFPPEVLSNIFILARHQSIEFKFRFCDTHTPWIRVGHVCHHWREVALGCPSLWSVPVFTKPDLAQEMMQRSKMAALTIKSITGTWTQRMLEQLENAMAQIHRIQSIDLTLECHPQKLETILSPLLQPAPLLEEVVLYVTAHPTAGNQFRFPLDALSDAPRLRSIEFDGLNFSWESAIFRHGNFTDLQLTENHIATDGVSSFSQMMDALRHLPNLRTLQLNDSIPPHTTSNGNEKPLEFKSLEQLELRGEAVDCIFLLQRIQYPPCATVGLETLSTAAEDIPTISSLIGQNLRRTQSAEAGTLRSPLTIRSIRLSSAEKGIPEITFFDKFNSIGHMYRSLGTSITIRLSSDHLTLSQAGDSLLTSISDCFDLSSLQALLLDWSFTHGQIHMIQNSFGKLPKLRVIKFSDSTLPEICFAIAESLEGSSVESPEETQTFPPQLPPFSPVTVFPALRTLVVEDVDFCFSSEAANSLIDMLMKRSDMNAPIDRLCLEQYHGMRTWQKRLLGELVVDLEVDGKVIDAHHLDSNDDKDNEDGRDELDERDSSDDDYFSES